LSDHERPLTDPLELDQHSRSGWSACPPACPGLTPKPRIRRIFREPGVGRWCRCF